MNALDVEPAPFARILVPYDGSKQSDTALSLGIALAQRGAALDILNVLDMTTVITEGSALTAGIDPAPLIEALEAQGRALAQNGAKRVRAAGVVARIRVARGFPTDEIVKAADESRDALIVLGTHGRSGLPRTFLGSTTEGVLRSTSTPVLAVHADMALPLRPFSTLLLAVDESEPSDAAAHLAGKLARSTGASTVVCSLFDVNRILAQSGAYGNVPASFFDDMRDDATASVEKALANGGFAPGAATTSIVEGDPAQGIVAEAKRVGADCIVIGSHGRRGLRRFLLGSVAEHVVRTSPMPILVVRTHT